jgi:hypothetical protein
LALFALAMAAGALVVALANSDGGGTRMMNAPGGSSPPSATCRGTTPPASTSRSP